ncbi:FecR domain-containing protein [Bradyrhizobium sp. LHD-71]|uniref:FecR family protein n=1 Tax=Bradyrhizobium sp. LHD-71 TaxID=3072141 RepID=UPI00280E16C6|nr:FecR domain-containing protein [Bradyrhizobium sp. LHD-71]MDQ8728079.1 FecR domain-containing protein [Bradyrhizobium sp. LHD-71]
MTDRSSPEPTRAPAAPVIDGTRADRDTIRDEAYDWVVRSLRGEMKPAELAAMKIWHGRSKEHADAYAEARRVWNGLGQVAAGRADEFARTKKAGRSIAGPVLASPSFGRRTFLGAAIAASAVYGIARPPLDLWPSFSELTADLRTGAGEQRQVRLPATASLNLNTKTSLIIRSQTKDATQLELIAGEAVVSTDSGSPELILLAAGGRIVTDRAEFNVRCEGARVSITCLGGELAVQRNDAAISLRASQQVRYADRGIGAVTTADPDIVTAWRHGLLIFDYTPVSQVIEEINRYRSRRIVLMNDAIGQRLLTARLRTTETDKVVVQLVRIFGAKARTMPGGIIVLT